MLTFFVQKIKKRQDVFYQTAPHLFQLPASFHKQNTPFTPIPGNLIFKQEETDAKGVYLI